MSMSSPEFREGVQRARDRAGVPTPPTDAQKREARYQDMVRRQREKIVGLVSLSAEVAAAASGVVDTDVTVVRQTPRIFPKKDAFECLLVGWRLETSQSTATLHESNRGYIGKKSAHEIALGTDGTLYTYSYRAPGVCSEVVLKQGADNVQPFALTADYLPELYKRGGILIQTLEEATDVFVNHQTLLLQEFVAAHPTIV